MPPHPFGALLFDLDGTLVDSIADIAASANRALVRLGLEPLPEASVQGYVGRGARNLMRSCLGGEEERVDRALALFDEDYAQHALDRTAPYPGVVDLLEGIELPMAVVSNKPARFCRQILEGLGLAHHFEAILGDGSCPERKPSPLPLLRAMEEMGVEPSRGLVVGDGIPDLVGGRAAGMATCAALWGLTPREELLAERPDFAVESASELAALLAGDGVGAG